MKQSLLLVLFVSVFCGCTSQAQEDMPSAEELIERHHFQYPKPADLPEELKAELYIPFWDSNHYYIADYDGKRVSDLVFDDVVLFEFAPYFMGKIGEEYDLYTFPDEKVLERTFHEPLDINNFRNGDAKGYYDKLLVNGEEYHLPHPYEDTTAMDYTRQNQEVITQLITEGVLKENSRLGHHLHVYKYNSNEITLKLNDKLEVILESHPLFMPLDRFDLEAIPTEIRPTKEQLKWRPASIQEYYVLNDGDYGHVFTCDGNYHSSHGGWYNDFFSFYGLHRRLKFRTVFVPIGQFNLDGVKYYVRLTDGMEYRS